MVDPITDTASATAALTVALDIIADLLALRDYLFSTMEPEVRKAYEYSYDIRQNLIRLMDAIEGADYREETPDEKLNTPYQQDVEYINNKIEELKKYIEDIYEKYYPYPRSWILPYGVKEGGQKTEETNLASADTGQLVASIQQLGEKIDLVSASFGAPGVVEASFTTGVDGSSILNRLVAIDDKLNAFAVQNVEVQAEAIAVKIVEKTGVAVSPEEKLTSEQLVALISGETEKLPEQYQELLRLMGENQSIMYSYKDQLYRLEHMIQTKAMSIDQIYNKIVKKMWDEYKCGG